MYSIYIHLIHTKIANYGNIANLQTFVDKVSKFIIISIL